MLLASVVGDVLHWVSVGLQLIGIMLLLLGVAEVRLWLDRTADASLAGQRRLVRRVAFVLERTRHRYATLRGRPFHMVRHASGTFNISDSVSVAFGRAGAHPEGLSDHERLHQVEARVLGVQLQVDQLNKERAEDQRRLDAEREQLRAEIRDATRAGWQYIMFGLASSFLGVVVSGVA